MVSARIALDLTEQQGADAVTRAYDGLDRLTSETTPQNTVSYVYDNAGRRTSMTVTGQPAVNYTYDNANRLTGLTQSTSSVSLAYDNANRRTSLTLPNGIVAAYTYDADSHLTGLTYSLGNTQIGNLVYAYDKDGHAIERSGASPAPVYRPRSLPRPMMRQTGSLIGIPVILLMISMATSPMTAPTRTLGMPAIT